MKKKIDLEAATLEAECARVCPQANYLQSQADLLKPNGEPGVAVRGRAQPSAFLGS